MEFIAGSISGFSQIIVGHPFDTYKIWLQSNNSKNKIKYNLKNLKCLYRGIKYPIYTNCLINGIMFGCNHNFYNYTKNHWISGFLTGLLTGFICGPMELYKIRKQTNLTYPKNWRIGLPITILRESIACSIYFGSFDYFNNYYSIFISGGLAGLFGCAIPHPIDTIKTRIQSNLSTIPIINIIKKGNLYSGFLYTCIRALIVNSIGFPVYHFFIKETI
jgi:solute carrier family 25 carnitine/acylcarnitine transporter 20/29